MTLVGGSGLGLVEHFCVHAMVIQAIRYWAEGQGTLRSVLLELGADGVLSPERGTQSSIVHWRLSTYLHCALSIISAPLSKQDSKTACEYHWTHDMFYLERLARNRQSLTHWPTIATVGSVSDRGRTEKC